MPAESGQRAGSSRQLKQILPMTGLGDAALPNLPASNNSKFSIKNQTSTRERVTRLRGKIKHLGVRVTLFLNMLFSRGLFSSASDAVAESAPTHPSQRPARSPLRAQEWLSSEGS